MILLLAIMIAIVAVIAWDAGWAMRESSEAFRARFNRTPQLALDQQHYRGVICGKYRFSHQQPNGFVFVSHYFSDEDREGLLIQSDPQFPTTANKLCRAS
jgi:hypothetical protein